MRWGEGKCKGRWEKCGGGVKNVLGGEGDVEKGVRVWRRQREVRRGVEKCVGVWGR